MHCANLDTLVKGMNSVELSPPQVTLPTANQNIAETNTEDEDIQILKMVLDIGIFVLEGRHPQRKSKRGYVEGPHCVLQPRTQTHQCDYNNYVCERAKKYRRLMESIWNENKALCIELRVCSDCSCGEEQVWKNSISRFDYVLEQWYFEITNFRNSEEDIGVMNWYGLLQAIRSQIHFSQLSAWWSSNQAHLPRNITYRVIPLTQVDVNSCPSQHTFPVLAFNSTYLQVKVRSQPRSEMLPKIHCPIHCSHDDVVDDRMKIHCDRLGKHHCQAVEDLDENENETWYSNEGTFCDGFVETEKIEDIMDKEATRKVKVMKYHCSNSDDTDVFKLARNEYAVGDWRFPTFRKNSNILTSRHRHIDYPNSRSAFHSSSILQGSPSLELSRMKSDFSPCGSCNTNKRREPPFNACSKTKTEAENRIDRANICTPFTCFSLDAELHKPERHLIPLAALMKTNRAYSQSNAPSDEEKNEEGVYVENEYHYPDRNNICKSDSPLTSVISAAGAGDKCTETVFHFSSKTSDCKDSNNNTDMVGIRGSNGEPRKNSKLLAKTFVANGRPDQKFDKLKTTIIKKYFRTKKTATKRLLPLFGNVIESVLSGRMYFSSVVDNFKIKITSCVPFGSHSGSTELPAAAYYYHFGDVDLSRSYLVKSCIPEREKGIQISSVGQLQVNVFNTENSLVKVFIIPYDLTDMPRCTKTYVRHSNYYAPPDVTKYSIKWLQSLIQFKCTCSKSGRLYLQNEINIIMFQKSDLNTACELQERTELKHHNVTEIAFK